MSFCRKVLYCLKVLTVFSFMTFPLIANEVFGLVLFREGETLVTRGILEFDAQVEEVLFFEDEIETGEDSSLQITFDSSFITIGPNTVCTIEKVEENGQEIIKVILDEGSLRSKILNLGSRQFFEVESDSGKLRVHGTDFVAQVPEDSGSFDVSVIHGKVALQGETQGQDETSGGPLFLSERESSSVGGDSNDSGGEVGDLSFQDVDDLKEALPIPGDDASGIPSDAGDQNLIAVDEFVEEFVQELAPEVEEPSEQDDPEDDLTNYETQLDILGIDVGDLSNADSFDTAQEGAAAIGGDAEAIIIEIITEENLEN